MVAPPKHYFDNPDLMQTVDPQLANTIRQRQKILAMPDGPEKDKALQSHHRMVEIQLNIMFCILIAVIGFIGFLFYQLIVG